MNESSLQNLMQSVGKTQNQCGTALACRTAELALKEYKKQLQEVEADFQKCKGQEGKTPKEALEEFDAAAPLLEKLSALRGELDGKKQGLDGVKDKQMVG